RNDPLAASGPAALGDHLVRDWLGAVDRLADSVVVVRRALSASGRRQTAHGGDGPGDVGVLAVPRAGVSPVVARGVFQLAERNSVATWFALADRAGPFDSARFVSGRGGRRFGMVVGPRHSVDLAAIHSAGFFERLLADSGDDVVAVRFV